uniref:Uncharacterized protein n=1 Tax=Salix viminalis TaxID=40686 RepID=A0A6N2LZK7_SALVM
MNMNATTSRPIDPTDLDDNYMSEVPSSFPNEEDNYMSGFQHLLASQSYPRVAGDNEDEENDIDDPINQDGNNDQNEDCLQSDNGTNSSGNNDCIKRKGFDTEIDPLTKKRQLSLYGRTEFNNASCGREIENILRCNFKGPWHSWEKVDSMYKDELFKEFKQQQAGGKELPWDDVFSMLHQNVNETGTFIDNRSKTVVENYRNEMIANKGRVCGAPHMPKSKVSASSSQHFYSVHSTYPSIVIQELKDELQVKDALLSNMQRQIESITNYLGAQHGSYVRSEFMSQGMLTPVDTMSSHTMAPIGLVSSTVYRPRPHLPNSGPSSSHPQHRKSFPP